MLFHHHQRRQRRHFVHKLIDENEDTNSTYPSVSFSGSHTHVIFFTGYWYLKKGRKEEWITTIRYARSNKEKNKNPSQKYTSFFWWLSTHIVSLKDLCPYINMCDITFITIYLKIWNKKSWSGLHEREVVLWFCLFRWFSLRLWVDSYSTLWFFLTDCSERSNMLVVPTHTTHLCEWVEWIDVGERSKESLRFLSISPFCRHSDTRSIVTATTSGAAATELE